MRGMVLLFSLALALGVWSNQAPAQVLPENHYLVYEVPQVYTFPGPITLGDQFGFFTTPDALFDKFATPVSKNGEPIFEPMLHQTWWNIFDPQSIWWVLIANQFGQQRWQVKDGRYLVLPAFKNQPGTLPPWNHYKCYDAWGPDMNIPVLLHDQFGTRQLVATKPKLFCNPVEKIMPDGIRYPIIYPETHLACYELQPPQPLGIPAIAFDQFGMWDMMLLEPCWLCLPTIKLQAVPNQPESWGKIKSLYGE
jgi:hypothetical protein